MSEKRKPSQVEWILSREQPSLLNVKKSQVKLDLSSNENTIDAILGKTENDFLPWEEVQLPSLGLYYGGAIPEGKVYIRPMGITAEKILSTQRLAYGGKAVDLVLKVCLKIPNQFKFEDLLLGDKNFILYYLRGITYGPDYEFSYICSNCSKPTDWVASLINVEVKKANPDMGEEPFKIVLPIMSEVAKKDVWVKVKMWRVSEYREVLMSTPTMRRIEDIDATIDENMTQNLARLIVEIGAGDGPGVTDRSKIEAFVDRMHSDDAKRIDQFLADVSPGIESKVKMTCRHCHNEQVGDLPITESFLRPSK